MITSIIRNLEDSNPNNELRLVGPLDQVKFNRLTKSKTSGNGEKWIGGYLCKDYDYLRLHVLDKLSDSGFGGLSSLLVGSLRSLGNKHAYLEELAAGAGADTDLDTTVNTTVDNTSTTFNKDTPAGTSGSVTGTFGDGQES
ncbi:unnamed protein product [Ambrosiozyma monospora]|uniref:Unnamed protein product n=1 Tax=Ambrosiozyma monospora TaxID=43982 RepID=A0ACB5T5R2_AMBMO|nr:unnamed protein product [Ambrosiozyma monospora]